MEAARPPDDSQAWRCWVGTMFAFVLGTGGVILRIFARRKAAAGFWWDDYTIISAMLLLWSMVISRIYLLVHIGYGRHAVYLGKDAVLLYWKAFMGVQVEYFMTAVLTKISLLLLYHRIFGVVKKFRWALWFCGFIVIGYWIATTILAFLGCSPFEKNFDQKLPGHCINLVMFFRVNGICNLVIDFIILMLPLPMVWRLTLPIRQKIVLSAIFGLGLFTCVTSILRVSAFRPTQVLDSTYSTVPTVTWSIVEQGLGVLCACLPTLRPLFNCFQNRSRAKSGLAYNGYNGYGGGGSSSNNNEQMLRSTNGIETPAIKTPWRAVLNNENDSTTGFARLHDEEHALTPIDVQRSVYSSKIGTAVSTPTAVPLPPESKQDRHLGGIMKEQRIEVKSEDGNSSE